MRDRSQNGEYCKSVYQDINARDLLPDYISLHQNTKYLRSALLEGIRHKYKFYIYSSIVSTYGNKINYYHSIYNDIYSKYFLKEICLLSNSTMIYKFIIHTKSFTISKRLYNNFINIKLAQLNNIQYLSLESLIINNADSTKQNLGIIQFKTKQIIKVGHPPIQSVEPSSAKTADLSQFIPMLFQAPRPKQGERETTSLTYGPTTYRHNVARERAIGRSDNQFQSIKLVRDQALNESVTTMARFTHSWHWLSQRRETHIAYIQSRLPIVRAQYILQQDIISKPYDGVLPSNGMSVEAGCQLGKTAAIHMLTKISGQNIVTTIRTPRSEPPPGALIPMVSTWLASVVSQRVMKPITGHPAPCIITNRRDDTYHVIITRQPEYQEPSRLPYTFAQLQRPMAQEGHVSTRIQEQEVVKVVRHEIQSYMASGSAVKQFSRDDFAHIADRVYSSFARRLLVERERLGLR